MKLHPLRTRVDLATAIAFALGLVGVAHGSHFLLEHPQAGVANSWLPLMVGGALMVGCALRVFAQRSRAG